MQHYRGGCGVSSATRFWATRTARLTALYARVRDTKRRGRETAGAIDGFVDPTSSTSVSTVSTRRLPSSRRCGLCAGQAASRVTWILVWRGGGVSAECARSARQSGCEARTAHRARLDQLARPRPRRPQTPQLTSELAVEAWAVAQRPSCRGTEARGKRDDLVGKPCRAWGARRRECVGATARRGEAGRSGVRTLCVSMPWEHAV